MTKKREEAAGGGKGGRRRRRRQQVDGREQDQPRFQPDARTELRLAARGQVLPHQGAQGGHQGGRAGLGSARAL
eukprot:8977287-Pyramimonas_sp.AAC.1